MDELRSGLELATDEELHLMAELLFEPKFNPFDYLCTPQPIDISKHQRHRRIALLEQRFRYLAADGLSVLQQRTHQVSYHQTLQRVCRHLKVRQYEGLSVTELESEVFLVLLEKAWKQMPRSEKKRLERQLQSAIASTREFEQLPKLLKEKPLSLLAKGGSAIALSAVVRPWLLRQIAQQFALHMAQYQVAKQTLVKGGLSMAAQVNSRATAQLATQGMVKASARYGAMRGAMACLGPALWTWFLADLGWRAVATNYARVIPVIFALAQIRLTREPVLTVAV